MCGPLWAHSNTARGGGCAGQPSVLVGKEPPGKTLLERTETLPWNMCKQHSGFSLIDPTGPSDSPNMRAKIHVAWQTQLVCSSHWQRQCHLQPLWLRGWSQAGCPASPQHQAWFCPLAKGSRAPGENQPLRDQNTSRTFALPCPHSQHSARDKPYRPHLSCETSRLWFQGHPAQQTHWGPKN